MGIFSVTPKNKREEKQYEAEKARALKVYNTEKNKSHMERLKVQARFDALPRSERAKQRLTKGFNALKNGAHKLRSIDERLEAKARTQGSNGGIIQQGYGKDLRTAANTPPLLQQSLKRDQSGTYSGGVIQQSLQGPQGEGLIQQSLRGQVRRKR